MFVHYGAKMVDKKVIILGFDGTIADTIPSIGKFAKETAAKYSDKEIKNYGDYTIKNLFEITKVPFWMLPNLVKDFKEKHAEDIAQESGFCQGVDELLVELKKKYKVGIITSNSKEAVEKFLEKNGVSIDFLYADCSLFGKQRAFNKVLIDFEINANEALSIGDEIRDINSSKKARIPFVAVTWGLNTRRLFEKYKTDFIVDSPTEILDILSK